MSSSTPSPTIHAPRPSRPVRISTLTDSMQSINIPSGLLSQVEEVDDVYPFQHLQPDQHVAQVEVKNGDSTTSQVFVVVQQQQQSETQSTSPHPGTAAYYDDCVSDYSHPPPSPPSQRCSSPSHAKKRVDADSVRSLKTSGDVARLRRMAKTPLNATTGADAVSICLGSIDGLKHFEQFKILKVYAIRAKTKARVMRSDAEQAMRRQAANLDSITAKLISFGKDVLDREIEKMRTSRSTPAEKPSPSPCSTAVPRREVPVNVTLPHNDIHPTYKAMPREMIEKHERQRRAAYDRPAMPKAEPVSRKPVSVPQQRAAGKIDRPMPSRKPVPPKKQSEPPGERAMRPSRFRNPKTKEKELAGDRSARPSTKVKVPQQTKRHPLGTAVRSGTSHRPPAKGKARSQPTDSNKPLPPVPNQGSKQRTTAQHQAAWEQPGYKPPPRVCQPPDLKPVINSAYDVQSHRASIATMASSGTDEGLLSTRASTTSLSDWPSQQHLTPPSSHRGSATCSDKKA